MKNHRLLVPLALSTLGLIHCGSSSNNNPDGGGGPGSDGGGGTSSLPTNCADAANASKPACASKDPAGGTIGSGPSVYDNGVTNMIAGGYLDGDTAVMAVHGDSMSGYGFVLSVDLKTGNRKVISGAYTDAMGMSSMTVGSGPMWNQPMDVAKGKSGLYVISVEGPGSPSIFQVDASGNRTLVFDSTAMTCSEKAGAGPSNYGPASNSVATDGSGVAYTAGNGGSSQIGVDTIDATGKCTIISYTDPMYQVGTGFAVDDLKGITISGATLYGLSFPQDALYSVDLATGNRALVSSDTSGMSKGAGDPLGTDWVKIGTGGVAWTTASGDLGYSFTVTKVDLASGNRTGITAATGSLAGGNSTTSVLLGEWNGKVVLGSMASLHLLDPVSKDSNRISR